MLSFKTWSFHIIPPPSFSVNITFSLILHLSHQLQTWEKFTAAHLALRLRVQTVKYPNRGSNSAPCTVWFIASVWIYRERKITAASLTDGPLNLFLLSAKSAWRGAPWVCAQTFLVPQENIEWKEQEWDIFRKKLWIILFYTEVFLFF